MFFIINVSSTRRTYTFGIAFTKRIIQMCLLIRFLCYLFFNSLLNKSKSFILAYVKAGAISYRCVCRANSVRRSYDNSPAQATCTAAFCLCCDENVAGLDVEYPPFSLCCVRYLSGGCVFYLPLLFSFSCFSCSAFSRASSSASFAALFVFSFSKYAFSFSEQVLSL